MVLAGMALATVLAATPPMAEARRPDVLLITVDTLRPDALGWISGRNDTPNLDRLAAEGFRFPGAVAPVPLTLPSHVTLMSGLNPPRHGVRDNGEQLGEGPVLLAAALGTAGYATAAFVSGFPLSRQFGLDRGFEHYDDELSAGSGAWLERPASETTAAALAWLGGARSPWFLWIHYYEPHYPYLAHPKGGGPVADNGRGAYDGEVAAVDRALAALLDGARASASTLLTVFAGDHGESLGEHGESTHGYFIYDSTVLVPLVFHYPEVVRPRSSTAPARLVDVAPTALDLLGLPPISDTDGISLAPLLAGQEIEVPPAYLETYQPWHSYAWAPLVGMRSAEWKWIAAPRPELYHLTLDRGEARNLAESEPKTVAGLDRLLRQIVRGSRTEATRIEDAEAQRRLAALGYVASGVRSAGPSGGEPDPKDRLALRELLTVGEEQAERGELTGALARFDEVLAAEPDNPLALSRSAAVLVRLGRAPEAVARLRRAADASPEQVETRALLAETLGEAGEHAAAAAEWMEVVDRLPRAPRYWSNLGAELGRSGRPAEAVTALERAWELEPDDPDRLVRLAFGEYAAGRRREAAEHLGAVAERLGDRFPHSGALGLILLELGEGDAATPWLRRAGAAEPEFAEARWRLARLELERGDREAARRALVEAIGAAPEMRARAIADPDLSSLLE